MRPNKSRVCATSSENIDRATAESKNLVQGEVAAVGNLREELAEAVRRNTEMLERLFSQMQMAGTSKNSERAARRRPPTCWASSGGVGSVATFDATVRKTRSGRRLGSNGGRKHNNRPQIAPSPNCQYSDSACSFYRWESRRSIRINSG